MTEPSAPRIDAPSVTSDSALPPPPGLQLTPLLGDIRNPVTVILLSIVTFGIYGLYWTYVMFRDTREFSGQGFGGLVGLALAIVLPFLPPFLLPWQVGRTRADAGRDRRVRGWWGLWWLVPIAGWMVWVVAVQRAANELWEAERAPV